MKRKPVIGLSGSRMRMEGGYLTGMEKSLVNSDYLDAVLRVGGLPVIIPYTAKDVDDWAIMFKRCYEMTGMTNMDRIQITPGYGLWTAGIGFQGR